MSIPPSVLTITKGREGKELAEIGSMKQRGAVAFSDDGVGVADASVMRKALQYSKMFDAVLMQHDAGVDAIRTADDSGHAPVVRLRAALEPAGMLVVDGATTVLIP